MTKPALELHWTCDRYGFTPRVFSDGNNLFEVESSDGKTRYHVVFAGCGDSDGVFLWECDCPAGIHGRHCKHIDAVGRACSYD